jgi:hypothetical protein
MFESNWEYVTTMWSSNMPFYPWNAKAREFALIPFPSTFFTFGFIVESIKELGGASICQMLNFDSSFMI